jgi:hypothetical protein
MYIYIIILFCLLNQLNDVRADAIDAKAAPHNPVVEAPHQTLSALHSAVQAGHSARSASMPKQIDPAQN